jgi:hypothetical protein
MSIADISSVISSAAVLATLVLILLQMRQSTQNQKAILQQGRSARILASQVTTLQPQLAEVMTRAYASDLTLSPVEVRTINGFVQSFFWSQEDSFLQHQAGLLDDEGWQNDLTAIRNALVLPAFRVGWKMSRVQTGGAYRAFIDAQLGEVKPGKGYPEASIWKHLMEKELASVA